MVPLANDVITPLVVTRETMLAELLVNQRLPSGPATMSSGWLMLKV